MAFKDWKYEAGKWTEIEPPFSWNEGEDLKVALERAGYNDFPSETYGEETQGVEIYCRRDSEPPWYVTFDIADYCFSVLIYDERSLLEWIAKYTPAYSVKQVSSNFAEALDILRKAFRVWHRHDPADVCRNCDPVEYQRLQEFDKRRASKGKLNEPS